MTPTPTRRALLIGAPAPDLAGVEHDLELMTAALTHHGFAIDRVVPATRARIVSSIAELIERTEADDVVVLYYSGHGAKLDPAQVDGAIERGTVLGEAGYYRFLIPSDFEESTEDDFRGYTNVELSLDLEALTRKSKNVIAIMDCCHAGRVYRNKPAPAVERLAWQDPSQLPPVRNLEVRGRWARAAARHYQRLRETRGLELLSRDAEANPHAVRLLASSSEGRAYEVELPSGRRAGAMTVALSENLLKVDPAHTTWQELGRLIRQRPQRASVRQQVAIEGPHRRLLFSRTERCELGELDIEAHDGRVWIGGGRLAGLDVGDRLELRTLGDRDSFVAIGEAMIASVGSSLAEIRTAIDPTRLARGGSARPLGYARPRAAVELTGFEPGSKALELLRARIEASGLVCAVEPGMAIGDLPIVGQLRLDADRLQLRAASLCLGPHVFAPQRCPQSAEHLAEHLADAVHRLARATCLTRLCPTPYERLEPTWELAWGLVEHGRVGPPLTGGERLRVGERLTLRVSTSQSIRMSALSIDADARIRVITRAQAGSVEVEPAAGYLLGQRSGRDSIDGIELLRPSLIDPALPAPVTIVVVISDVPVDLRSWEQHGLTRFVRRDPLAPASSSRNIAAPSPRPRMARYHVQTITLELGAG